jgi:heme o synthase
MPIKIQSAMALIRFSLSAMVTFSAIVGYLIHGNFQPVSCLLLVGGVFLLAGGTSALNQFQEKKRDKLMQRTARRPLVSGVLPDSYAVILSLIFISSGTILLATIGWKPAALGLVNVFLYNVAYTYLKPKTALAILPGALVGAIPPMMGWSAADGNLLHPTILFVASFMFLWQLPHFWLLLMVYGKDYEKAGFKGFPKMLSQTRIKLLIFLWTSLSSAFLFLFPVFDIHMLPHQTAILVVINATFILLFFQLLMQPSGNASPKKAFIALNSYVMLILVFFVWVAQ